MNEKTKTQSVLMTLPKSRQKIYSVAEMRLKLNFHDSKSNSWLLYNIVLQKKRAMENRKNVFNFSVLGKWVIGNNT